MAFRLTYCGNVHAAEELDPWIAAAERYSVPVAAQRAEAGHRFGLGVWWNARLTAELRAGGEPRERLRRWLRERGLEIWTLNVFPFGDFHDERVKTGVYRPDWSSEDRLQYTLRAAEIVADLVAPGSVVPMSTLPLGYGEGGATRQMARNLVRAASALSALADRTGVEVVLALEPEPFCLCETVAATSAFLQECVFGAPDSPVPETTLRKHLGVCIDLCHLAVVGEEPLQALAELDRAGVRMPKVQVSSCLELRDPAGSLDVLLEFEEQRYLHQTVSFDGGLRALDLDEVRRRRSEFAAAEGLRTHFHMPVYWDADGALGSTRGAVGRFLQGLTKMHLSEAPLLEIETYTWSVLGAEWRPDRDLVSGLASEFEFVDRELAVGG